MSDFKAKIHQIRCRLGLRPRPRSESVALPRDLAGFKGARFYGQRREGKENRKELGEGG